ncbi:MAG: DUF3576 domain-containing protein [Alphaproteobacteria bacterium]
MKGFTWRWRAVARGVAAAALLGLGACEYAKAVYPERDSKRDSSPTYRAPGEEPKRETIFGEGGIGGLFGTGKVKPGEGGGGIGVNSLLWRAALDTIAFMPLSSADPFGGVIITDWYAPADSPNERFKVNIYILSKTLRADALRVSAFRQIRSGTGAEWAEAPVDVATDLENAILTRARQLRMATSEM